MFPVKYKAFFGCFLPRGKFLQTMYSDKNSKGEPKFKWIPFLFAQSRQSGVFSSPSNGSAAKLLKYKCFFLLASAVAATVASQSKADAEKENKELRKEILAANNKINDLETKVKTLEVSGMLDMLPLSMEQRWKRLWAGASPRVSFSK